MSTRILNSYIPISARIDSLRAVDSTEIVLVYYMYYRGDKDEKWTFLGERITPALGVCYW